MNEKYYNDKYGSFPTRRTREMQMTLNKEKSEDTLNKGLKRLKNKSISWKINSANSK